jgi:DNA adenine methylase
LELDQGTYWGDGATVPFYRNRWVNWGSRTGYYYDFKFFNTALSLREVSHYYNLSLPDIPSTPPTTPSTPPTLPTLHWDFKTFYDSNHAVEFTNPFEIDNLNGDMGTNQTGTRYFLIAEMPSNLVSKFSKTLMFRFKALSSIGLLKGDAINFLFTTYTSFIPDDIDTYLEPFVGGGATFFHLNHKKNVISDVHTELIDFYQCIKNDEMADIHTFMSEHEFDEASYLQVRDNMDVLTPLDNAKRFYYLQKNCFRGILKYNKDRKFISLYGRECKKNFKVLQNENYTNLLKNTTVLHTGFEYVFEHYNSPTNFMFLDPPYDCKHSDYGYSKFGKEEHKKMAEDFKNTNIRCLMIVGKTDSELYEGYIVEEYQKKMVLIIMVRVLFI